MTRRWSAFGSRRTVCSVVTTGILNSRSNAKKMAAGGSAENAELVLHTDNVHVADVEEIRGAPVRSQILLLNFEANHVRIIVAPFDVVDGHREAPACGMPRCHSAEQVGRERGDATFARQIVAEKRDLSNAGLFHNGSTFFPLVAAAVEWSSTAMTTGAETADSRGIHESLVDRFRALLPIPIGGVLALDRI